MKFKDKTLKEKQRAIKRIQSIIELPDLLHNNKKLKRVQKRLYKLEAV